jgi:hypothetical protein
MASPAIKKLKEDITADVVKQLKTAVVSTQSQVAKPASLNAGKPSQ